MVKEIMTTDKILKVLRNERECINTERKGKCNYHCKNCQYRNSNTDKLEVLNHLISIVESEAIIIDVSEEDKKAIVEQLAVKGYVIHRDLITKYGSTD